MDRTDIENSYRRIAQYHKTYLKESGVKLPKLYHCGSFGMGALILVKLFEGYPNTKIHSKEELSEFWRGQGHKPDLWLCRTVFIYCQADGAI